MVSNRYRRGGKPLISLSVEPLTDDTVDLFGKVSSDLQENVAINGGAITGTLKYVDDYSSAYGPGEDSGNYLVLKFESEDADSISVEIINGTSGPVTLDEDGIWIGRIADKDSQTVKVVASKDGASVTKTYTLSGLTLQPAG